MNKNQPIDKTVEHYQRNAASFAQDTQNADLRDLYREFLPLVPAGGKILDAGCGSGRDSLYFKQLGYSVAAFDASSELAQIASRTIGQPVKVTTFQEMDARDEYDGIWACASLLHVPQSQMDDAFSRLTRSLKGGGVIYASFKYGRGESERGGRMFNDYDEAKLDELMRRHPQLESVKVWRTEDCRPDRHGEWWLNTVLRKVTT